MGDDSIIARIKTGNCYFALSDKDLAQLKKGNVSDEVIAAMLEASVLTKPRVTIDGNPLELHTRSRTLVQTGIDPGCRTRID